MSYHAETFPEETIILREGTKHLADMLAREVTLGDCATLSDAGFSTYEGIFVGFSGQWHDYLEGILIAIAPLVEDGSALRFMGEDNYLWAYEYEGGKVTRREGNIIWK